jgi:hypothetical protein
LPLLPINEVELQSDRYDYGENTVARIISDMITFENRLLAKAQRKERLEAGPLELPPSGAQDDLASTRLLESKSADRSSFDRKKDRETSCHYLDKRGSSDPLVRSNKSDWLELLQCLHIYT